MLRSAFFSLVCATGALLAPVALAQWEATGGPDGARFYGLQASEGAVFARTDGPVRRYSAAEGWQAVLPHSYFDPVASGSAVFARGPDGLLRSTDDGAAFDLLPGTASGWAPLHPDGETLLAVAPASETDVSLVLQLSTDDGASWRSVRDSVWVTPFGGGGFHRELQEYVGAVLEGDAVLAAGTAYVFGGVFRKAPGDTSWVPLYGTVSTDGPLDDALDPRSFLRHDGALWFAYQSDFGNTFGIVRSLDGGDTWTDVSAGLPATSQSQRLIAGSAGLFLYTSAALYRWDGAIWEAVPAPPTRVQYAAASDALYGVIDGIVHRLDDEAWIPLPKVVASSPVPRAAGAPAGGPGALFVWWNGIQRSVDGGSTFEEVLDSFGPSAAGGDFFLVSTLDGLRLTSDGGDTWEALPDPPLPSAFAGSRPNALAWDGETFVGFYGEQRFGKHGVPLDEFGGVYRLVDDAWQNISSGLPTSGSRRVPVDGGSALPDGFFAYTDRGCYGLDSGQTTWGARSCPGTIPYEIYADDTRWITRAPAHISVSLDRGASWAPFEDGLLPTDAHSMHLVPTSAGLLMMYESDGAPHAARLDGEAWTMLDAGFPEDVPLHSFLEGDDGFLYAGSEGAGLWRAPIAFAQPVATDAPMGSDAFALMPPAPNPSSGSISIRYALPEAGEATLEVLDVLGRRVALLASGPQPQGVGHVRWSPAGMAPGLYLVRLRRDGEVEVQRVTVTG